MSDFDDDDSVDFDALPGVCSEVVCVMIVRYSDRLAFSSSCILFVCVVYLSASDPLSSSITMYCS